MDNLLVRWPPKVQGDSRAYSAGRPRPDRGIRTVTDSNDDRLILWQGQRLSPSRALTMGSLSRPGTTTNILTIGGADVHGERRVILASATGITGRGFRCSGSLSDTSFQLKLTVGRSSSGVCYRSRLERRGRPLCGRRVRRLVGLRRWVSLPLELSGKFWAPRRFRAFQAQFSSRGTLPVVAGYAV
jgi:hypothetical protein